jgi:hypothetical protein
VPREIKPQREQWLEKAIERIPALSYRDDAIGELRKHVKRCHARSVQRFYQWLRTTLAKVSYPQLLSYFKPEDDPKPEAPVGQSEPFSFISNGGLALIDVDKAIWKIPIVRLDFARSVWPVYVKQLPALEHPERRKIRDLKEQLKTQSWKWLPAMRTQAEAEIVKWEDMLQRAEDRNPIARYGIFKSINGRETGVHRLYMNAGTNEDVAAANGDLTDFGTVKMRVTVEPMFFVDTAVIPGNADPQCPQRIEQDVEVPNLYLIQSGDDNPHPGHNKDLRKEQEKDVHFESMASEYQQDRLKARAEQDEMVRRLQKQWGVRK